MTPTSPPEADRFARLMRATQAGDGAAYATLLRELVPVLRRVVRARGRLTNDADVEDVVQEILLSVHSVRATYDPGRPFLPWLLAIARNRLLDALRRQHRTVGREVGLEDETVTFWELGANPEAGSVGPGDADMLHRAIEELPDGQRQAITLLKLQGLSLRQASVATGLTAGALKVATHRAMVALRRKLTGD